MRLSFTRKLALSYLFVVAVTLLITGTYLTHRLRADFLLHLEESLSNQAILMRPSLLPFINTAAPRMEAEQEVVAWAQQLDSRITLINKKGVVLADSERTFPQLLVMENHSNRPEIAAALSVGNGRSIRYSHTLHENMLYVAVPMFDPRPENNKAGDTLGVLRIALSLTEVNRRIATLQYDLLKAGAAAVLVAILVAAISIHQITRPLEALTATARSIGQGQFPLTPIIKSRDEFGELAQAFSDMACRIEDKVGELSREREQLTTILSALVESVIAVDHQGKVLFLNPAAERLFDVRSGNVKDRPFLEVLRHSLLTDVLQHVLKERRPASQEITVQSPEEHTLMIHAVPVSYEDQHTGVLAALHDITELRKLERIRQEFVANVSHELKTPLTAIRGYVETLLDGALEDAQHNRQFLQIINDHAHRLSQLIDDVLDLSAIEAKRVDFRFEPVTLTDVIERIIRGTAPMAKAKGVSVKNELSPALPKVRGDREKLAQIFINLIDNAIKFNKTGGSVEITAHVQNQTLQVSIRDTGMGIPKEDLPRIFERFYRVDKAHSHDIPGTGLGLAIVKHLVEAHSGEIHVESTPGQGSLFQFTLLLV